jgi:Tfp pilus assembly protein FimT
MIKRAMAVAAVIAVLGYAAYSGWTDGKEHSVASKQQ